MKVGQTAELFVSKGKSCPGPGSPGRGADGTLMTQPLPGAGPWRGHSNSRRFHPVDLMNAAEDFWQHRPGFCEGRDTGGMVWWGGGAACPHPGTAQVFLPLGDRLTEPGPNQTCFHCH